MKVSKIPYVDSGSGLVAARACGKGQVLWF